MKKFIGTGFIAASILVSSMVIAKDERSSMQGSQCTMGSSVQMQQMMDKRMEMMKSSLKLNKKQEKALNTFMQQKKSMMEDMIGLKQASMKNAKGMHGDQMSDMHGKKGMQGQQGMMGNQQGMGGKMGMHSGMSFLERMNFMQKHSKKMQATSKAGKKFYNTLTAEQKKKMDDMPKNMNGMNMKQMR